MARGVRLTDYSLLEQADLLEAERMTLLIEFGKEVVRIMSVAQDSKHAQALIEHLKKIYFIGYEEQEKRKLLKDADELVRLSQMTFNVVQGPGGHRLEIEKK